MLESFSKEYSAMTVFEESSYKRGFDYKLERATLEQLNFCFLVDRKTFHQFARQIGFNEHDMLEEEFDESAATGGPSLKNDRLVDYFATTSLGFRSHHQAFDFLNWVTRSELEEGEVLHLNRRVFEHFRKLHPGFIELKRVLYRAPDGLKVEMNVPVVKVLCLDNDGLKDKRISIVNFKSYIKTLQVTKYMNQKDLLTLLREMAQKAFGVQVTAIHDYQVLLPDDDDTDAAAAKKIINGQIDVTLVGEGENLCDYNIYKDKLVIFYFKQKTDKWLIDFKLEGASAPPIVLEAPANRRLCAGCAKLIARDSNFKRVCVCGKSYCDYACKMADSKHKCEPATCTYCRKLCRTDAEPCDCGTIYCDSDCKDNDYTFHSKTCAFSKPPTSYNYSSYSYFRRESVDEDLLEGENAGRVGLSNIGNTCYMNSALQVALHTDLLRQFFLHFNFLAEANEDNVFGTKGVLLREMGDLYKTYHKTKNSKITPYRFKSLVAKFNTTFEGYSQHDSQEFWSYFLDAIHEDTNRILKKPYVENLQAKLGDDDFEVARKSWINHLKRNYSLVAENFTGQFKSTVECPRCDTTSITFDPYNLVSLSIPIINQHEFDFYFINEDQTAKAQKHSFVAKSLHNFNDLPLGELVGAAAKVFGVAAERVRVGILGFSFVGDLCKPADTIARLMEAKTYSTRPKIFLNELNDLDMALVGNPAAFPVLFKTSYEVYDQPQKVNKYTSEYYRMTREYQEDPCFTKYFFITAEHTVRELYVCVLRKLMPATNLADQKSEDQRKNQEFFRNYWNLIEKTLKDKRFFYIKQGDKLLSGALLDEKIGSVCDLAEGKLVLQVFVRSKGNTSVEVDLEKFATCSAPPATRDNDIVCASPDLANYKNEYSLNYLLENFSKSEILDSENTWYCPKCKEHVQARKRIQVYKIPNYLTLHLKKLKYQAKHIPLITFPVDELDMKPYVMNAESTRAYNIKPEEIAGEQDLQVFRKAGREFLIPEYAGVGKSTKYRLYGVVNHYGSQHFGHYTANVECADGTWADFNDSSVSPASKKDLVSDGAYILFYKRI